MDNLLTPEQAADLLGIHVVTLAGWRHKRNGPPYVILGINTDLSQGRKRATRYRLSDIEAWLASRTVNPRDVEPSKRRQVTGRHLTDAEWAAIVAAVKQRDRMGRLNPGTFNLGEKHRILFDRMLDACTSGDWPLLDAADGNNTRHRLRKGVRLNGWVLQAFDALTEFTDFPFTLAVQYVVIRRGRNRDLPTTALRLRTEAIGPLQGRKDGRIGDTAMMATRIRDFWDYEDVADDGYDPEENTDQTSVLPE